MKKAFFLFITLCIILLPACSDDEAWNVKHGKEVSKVYREPNLKMTLNGKEIKGKSALFLSSDLTTADIMLFNAIPGEDSLSFTGVKLTDTGKDNIYTFLDSTVNEDRRIYLEGQVGNGLIINVKHEVTSLVAGRWKTAIFPFTAKITANPLDSVDMKGFLNNDVIPIVKGTGTSARQDFVGLLRGLGLTVGLAIKLELEMKADDNLIVYWGPKISSVPIPEGQLEEGLARYNVNNGLFYPSVALDDILSTASISDLISSMDGDFTLDEILLIFTMGQGIYNGVPIPYAISGNKNQNLDIIVTKEMLLPYMATVVKLLKPLLADLDMGGVNIGGITPEGLTAFVEALGVVIEKSESFELKISFTRVS